MHLPNTSGGVGVAGSVVFGGIFANKDLDASVTNEKMSLMSLLHERLQTSTDPME